MSKNVLKNPCFFSFFLVDIYKKQEQGENIFFFKSNLYFPYSLALNFSLTRENVLWSALDLVHMGWLLQVPERLCCSRISPVAWHGSMMDRPGKLITETGEKTEAFNVFLNSLFIRDIRCEGAWNNSQF